MLPAAGRTRRPSSSLSAFAFALVMAAALLAATDAARPPAFAAAPAASSAPPEPWYEDEAPDPVRVRSSDVDIEAPTIPLGKHDDGSLQVPEDANTAGWWTGRANPGERGPAVIVGHVDSREGPGAFWELPDLEVGDRVSVDRVDGTTIHWRVDRVEQHPKHDFPTDAVYGPTDDPTLRLVTCSGFFDPAARSYTDNTIVFLSLDAEQEFEPLRPGRVEVERVPDARGGLELARAPTHPRFGAAASSGEPAPSEDRRLPIIVAAVSLLVASAAQWREWGARP